MWGLTSEELGIEGWVLKTIIKTIWYELAKSLITLNICGE